MVVERLNAGDVDGSVALCEPDAVMALPRDRAATGVREIRSARERSVSDHPTGSRTTATREHVGGRLGARGLHVHLVALALDRGDTLLPARPDNRGEDAGGGDSGDETCAEKPGLA